MLHLTCRALSINAPRSGIFESREWNIRALVGERAVYEGVGNPSSPSPDKFIYFEARVASRFYKATIALRKGSCRGSVFLIWLLGHRGLASNATSTVPA